MHLGLEKRLKNLHKKCANQEEKSKTFANKNDKSWITKYSTEKMTNSCQDSKKDLSQERVAQSRQNWSNQKMQINVRASVENRQN